MFEGTHPEVHTVGAEARRQARRRGHRRVGSEHLLLALAEVGGPSAERLAAHGATVAALDAEVEALDGLPAAVAADLEALEAAGLGVGGLAERGRVGWLDPRPPRHGLLPLGWRKAERWAAACSPPVGGEALAVNEAALWLALGTWQRQLRSHHLAQALVRWDRGARLLLARAGADLDALAADLAALSPAPRWRWPRPGHLRRAAALAT